MTDIDDIRSRMHGLTDQARCALQLHGAGAIGAEECRVLAGEMQRFMATATTRLLDLADQAIGDRRGAAELYETAMEIEEELLQDTPPIAIG